MSDSTRRAVFLARSTALTLGLLAGCSAPSRSLTPATSVTTSDLGPCRSQTVWSTKVYGLSKTAAADLVRGLYGEAVPPGATKKTQRAVFWWMIRALLVEGGYHNAAGMELKGYRTAAGEPLRLYRSGYTAAPQRPGSCFHHLVHQRGVRHVLNLYDGPMYTADLDAAEASVVSAQGGQYSRDQSHWRDEMRDAWRARGTEGDKAYEAARAKAHRAVAHKIRHLLGIGGEPRRGHLHVHCGGGMHRTSMVVGVIDRCVNGTSAQVLAERYRRHVGWTGPDSPGGYEAQNLDFIESFPCALIRSPAR